MEKLPYFVNISMHTRKHGFVTYIQAETLCYGFLLSTVKLEWRVVSLFQTF